MLVYLIWTLLNLMFYVLFFALILVLITKGKKLLRSKFGIVVIPILVLGLIGFSYEKEERTKNEYVLPTNDEFQGYEKPQTRIVMADNTLFDIALQVRFRKNTAGELIPVLTRSSMNGFVSNYQWKYDAADIEKVAENTYSYKAFGVVDWYFLDMKVYSEAKEFTGTFTFEG